LGYDVSGRQLCDLINDYRQANGLDRIPISMKLSLVAVEHVKDLATYHPEKNCKDNFHSWSTHGDPEHNLVWKGGCYDPNDSSTWDIMWNKPKEIAKYPSYGYEIAASSCGTPDAALQAWKEEGQPERPHNDVMLNKGVWASYKWKALGAALSGGYACAWFGTDADEKCFIATAAYGSPLADEVQFLRLYRENVVKRNRWGRASVAIFEKFYYSFSPQLASLVEGTDTLRYLARIFVADPVVDMLLIGSFAFRSGRKPLAYPQDARGKLLAGILMRGIGGWLYSISWILWNALLAYSFLRSEAITGTLVAWVSMMGGLVLTRIGAWIHKDIEFSIVASSLMCNVWRRGVERGCFEGFWGYGPVCEETADICAFMTGAPLARRSGSLGPASLEYGPSKDNL